MANCRGFQLRPGVTLAPLAMNAAPAMHRWMRDPEVSRNVGLRTAPSLEKSKAWIRKALADATMRPLAIQFNGEHVGNVVFDRMDTHLGTARLSIYIGEPAARGGGVGTAAVHLALAHAFGKLGLHKVWLTVHTRNAPAIASYVKLGFTIEGVLRDEFWLDGRRVSVFYMGLLRHEFERMARTGGQAASGTQRGRRKPARRR